MTNNLYPREIYNIDKRSYQWESFQYVVPSPYLPYQSSPNISIPKPPHKTNYLDDLYKITKHIPSPNLYYVNSNTHIPWGKFDKSLRKSIVNPNHQKIPGPNYYVLYTQESRKTPPPFVPKQPLPVRDHYLNQVQYHGCEVPGVGQYNIRQIQSNVQTPKYKPSKRPKTTTKTTNKTSTQQKELYPIVRNSFHWISNQKYKKTKNCFTKSKRFNKQNQQSKPAPNSYHFNNDWSSPLNTLKNTLMKSSKSNTNSIYYG